MRFRLHNRAVPRTRKAFLWLPKSIFPEVRWLETAYWSESFIDGRWTPTSWLHLHERVAHDMKAPNANLIGFNE